MESAFYGRAESLPAGETNKTEISEKGKPSERVGRKAMGSKVNPVYNDSPAANISIILIYFLSLRGERNDGKEY